jgi:hypothetical protein
MLFVQKSPKNENQQKHIFIILDMKPILSHISYEASKNLNINVRKTISRPPSWASGAILSQNEKKSFHN